MEALAKESEMKKKEIELESELVATRESFLEVNKIK